MNQIIFTTDGCYDETTDSVSLAGVDPAGAAGSAVVIEKDGRAQNRG